MIDRSKDRIKNLIIFFIKETKYCGSTKLAKLLYYLDFYHYQETGTSFTGLEYKAYLRGPYPEEVGKKILNKDPELTAYLDIVKKSEFTELTAKENFDDRFFSKRVLRILENILFMFKDSKAEEMIAASHEINQPWHITLKEQGEKAVIDYNLSLNDESPSREWIEEEAHERKEIKRILG